MPRPVPVFDVVLDDGSLLPWVAVIEDRAIGIIVGGQTGFFAFADVPEVVSRSVRHSLRLSRMHKLPVIGRWLRHRWAERVGASSAHASWIPKM